jgi:membrane protein DedA with SNARE-associated domain
MDQWIVDVMARFGYLGVFFLMVAENVFPPIPSEAIVPFAGFTAGQGSFDLATVIMVALAGSLLGNLPWFFAARWFGAERLLALTARFGRFFFVRPDDVAAAITWFDRHGPWAVFLGRLVPGVRTLISIPAGLSHMGFVTFVLYSALGSVIWIGVLAYLGFTLQQNWGAVEQALSGTGGIAVGIVALGLVGWLVWRHRRKARARRLP